MWFIVCHCGSFHFGHCIFFVLQYTVFDYFFDIVKRILTLLWKLLLTQIKDVHTLFNNSTLHKCLQNKKKYGGHQKYVHVSVNLKREHFTHQNHIKGRKKHTNKMSYLSISLSNPLEKNQNTVVDDDDDVALF